MRRKMLVVAMRISAVILAAGMMVSNLPMTVQAAEASDSAESTGGGNNAEPALGAIDEATGFHLAPDMEEPTCVADIFDEVYYKANYPEAAKECDSDKEKMVAQFKEKDVWNGNLCCAYFDVYSYRYRYPDLDKAFGDDWDKYVWHYYKYGKKEGRDASPAKKYKSDKSDKSADNNMTNTTITTDEQGIIYDNKGDILVPQEVIDNGYLTLDDLRAICGESLILVTDENGNVLFVGGRFSEQSVSDENEALSAMDCMMELLGVDTDTRLFQLSRTSTDTDGNTNYRFVAVMKDEDLVFTESDYILTVDSTGNVLSLSGSAAKHVEEDLELQKSADVLFEEAEEDLIENFPEEDGWEFVSDKAYVYYDQSIERYVCVAYTRNKNTGKVVEMRISIEAGENEKQVCYVTYDADDLVYSEEAGTYVLKAGTMANDYYFKQAEKYWAGQEKEAVRTKEFVDYFGNVVSLPVSYDEDADAWYICDTDRHIIGMRQNNGAEEIDISKLDLMYFTEDYFKLVETYKEYLSGQEDQSRDAMISYASGFDYLMADLGYYAPESDRSKYTTTFISSMESVIKSWDIYEKNTNVLKDNPVAIVVAYWEDMDEDNASCAYNSGSLKVNVYNDIGNAGFDSISHELGHGLWSQVAGETTYANTLGAIMESYADICGNLMEMMYQKDAASYVAEDNGFIFDTPYIGYVDYTNWTIEEFDPTNVNYIRNMSDPSDRSHPEAVEDDYYVDPVETPNGDNDSGGVHSNSGILNHVAYKMMGVLFGDDDDYFDYSNATADQYETMFKIWYNTLQYMNEDTTYSTVKAYVHQSLSNYYVSCGEDPLDASHQESLRRVDQLFDDANVSAADSYNYELGKATSTSGAADENDADAADEDVADEDVADEDAADEDAADEDAADEDAADEDAADEDAANEDAADENAANEDAANEDAADEDTPDVAQEVNTEDSAA